MKLHRLFAPFALCAIGFSQPAAPPPPPPANVPPMTPVTDAMLANPSASDWLMWRRTHNNWGYSPLNQINKGNVKNLRMVWTRGVGPGVQLQGLGITKTLSFKS